MYILGIHDGHNCGATIVKDGKICVSILEERITRNKNEVGFPSKSIIACLRFLKIKETDISYAVFSSKFMHSKEHLINPISWYKLNYQDQLNDEENPKNYAKVIFNQRKKQREQNLKSILNINSNRIEFYDHHFCHMAASFYTAPFNDEKLIIGITSDGSGDNLSGSVYLCKEGKFKIISKTSRDASLGKIYSRVTTLMGMRPWEHEYKVMGLAHYANQKNIQKVKKIFQSLIYVNKNKLNFKKKTKLSMNYCYEFLEKNLSGERFDNIAGAVQSFTEDLLVELVSAVIKKTKIKNIILGGGVFMNVKANNLISKIKTLKRLYIMPSSGDESLSIGAALHCSYKYSKKKFSSSVLKNLYLGDEFTINDEIKEIKKLKLARKNIKYYKFKKNLNVEVARLLAKGYVIARCAGRAEWGARALGNRSILSRADNYLAVEKINSMIKQRDFWMPFAPVIIKEHQKKYFNNPKKISCNFMTIAFNSLKNKNYKHIVAASHLRDKTIRPQLVDKISNPDLYQILKKFYKITGISALINTSFNLHGQPIVNSPAEAIDVFFKSGLDYLVLNNFIIKK
jgi:carbamoyltransferase